MWDTLVSRFKAELFSREISYQQIICLFSFSSTMFMIPKCFEEQATPMIA